MIALLERLQDFVDDAEAMRGDEYQQHLITSMTASLVEQMRDMDLDDAPTYRGMKLLQIGTTEPSEVGNVMCSRTVYLGQNGKFYVEGPRKSMGRTVIDIHSYRIADLRGWNRVTAHDLVDFLTTYFI